MAKGVATVSRAAGEACYNSDGSVQAIPAGRGRTSTMRASIALGGTQAWPCAQPRSAAEPNLVGVLTKHDRVPRTASNRVAYLDGVPVACLQGGEIRWFGEAPRETIPAILERLKAKLLFPAEPEAAAEKKSPVT